MRVLRNKNLFCVVCGIEISATVDPAIRKRVSRSSAVNDTGNVYLWKLQLIASEGLIQATDKRDAKVIHALTESGEFAQSLTRLIIDNRNILNDQNHVPAELASVQEPIIDRLAGLV